MNKGDRVAWSYTHHLNRKSKTTITKHGTYIRMIKKRGLKHWGWDVNKKCIVLFDGNKTYSIVQEHQLTFLTT